VRAAEQSTCVAWPDGSLKGGVVCWGGNNTGQLGQGDTIVRDQPDQLGDALAAIPLLGSAIDVAVGDGHVCAILESRQLQC